MLYLELPPCGWMLMSVSFSYNHNRCIRFGKIEVITILNIRVKYNYILMLM